MSHYQVNFEFRDGEEGLTPTQTISVGIGEDIYNALVASPAVEFQGRLFSRVDNHEPTAGRFVVDMVEFRPTEFGKFAGMAAISAARTEAAA